MSQTNDQTLDFYSGPYLILPPEIWYQITTYLGKYDDIMLSLTCRFFRDIYWYLFMKGRNYYYFRRNIFQQIVFLTALVVLIVLNISIIDLNIYLILISR